jgi:putative oxygen-independent coproporphyrinogen III oxidase
MTDDSAAADVPSPPRCARLPLPPGEVWGEGGTLAIYIHWPFCRSKCPYCDFNSHLRESIEEDRWRDAYLRELDRFAEETAGRPVTSIFFGGGTPSLMDPRTTAAILDRIAARWPLDARVEITLEANPSTAEAARFRAFREAGVDRISIGVQALDDQALRFLGRGHSAVEARAAVALAAKIIPRFSFDLIWGWPGHGVAAWRGQLRSALTMAGEHVSAYQLTVEPGTAFWRDGVPPLDEDTSVELFEITQEVLSTAGLPAYEVSNHARPGAECRHNLAVWRGADYLGIGPGAHGRLSRAGRTEATRAMKSPEKWLSRVEAGSGGLAERVPLTAHERCEELLLLGLRLTEGVRRHGFKAVAGVELEHAVKGQALARLVEMGFLKLDDAGMRTTPAGRLCLNTVVSQLLA